jgi:D-threonate/D-erythronate kinase
MIVVLADDLSGAAELTGGALRHGLSAELQTSFFPGTSTDVICVATDTRSLPAAQAATLVAKITREITAAKPSWIFKKCDSVLRGPVLAEIRAMATVTRKTRCLLIPANPTRGRIIRNGTYFINGQPLHETFFAHDPEHPRTTSGVAELLGGDLKGVEAPDVETTDELMRLAGTVEAHTLPVGAADFFEALLRRRVPARPVQPNSDSSPHGTTLLVCGSAAAWPERERETAARDIPVFALPHDAAAIVTALGKSRQALVGIGHGPETRGQYSSILLGKLADTVATLLRSGAVDRLLLEGGATAAAVMQAVDWTCLRAHAVSAQGQAEFVPLNASGPRIMIKPGSYAWPVDIWPTQCRARFP